MSEGRGCSDRDGFPIRHDGVQYPDKLELRDYSHLMP
jgi:hypothetical protein